MTFTHIFPVKPVALAMLAGSILLSTLTPQAIAAPAQPQATGATVAGVSALDTQRMETLRQQVDKINRESLKAQATQWGLTPEDYQHYQQLMNGPRGIQSPGLDPLSTLGIEAKTSAERRRFAELWVKQEYVRTEKELIFQREVSAAWKRLYPDSLPVSMGKAAGIAHDTGGRLALFVRQKDCTTCDARLQAILADNRPVDIYLVDSAGNDTTLRAWAKAHHIPAQKVRSRQITLNHDAGRWMRFGNGLMPVVLQQGKEGWRIAAY